VLVGVALGAVVLGTTILLLERGRKAHATVAVAPTTPRQEAQPMPEPARAPESAPETMSSPESATVAEPATYGDLRDTLAAIAARSGARTSITLFHPGRKVQVSVAGSAARPSASVIKLCILVSALRRVEEGKAKLDQRVGKGGKTLEQLLKAMITESDNAATNTLIDAMGLPQLDQEIHGLMALSAGTRLQRKMLDKEAQARGLDNTMTTDDIAVLLARLKQFEYLPLRGDEPVDKSLTALACGYLRQQKNRTKIPRGIPTDDKIVIGNKTGELDGIENDAAIIDDSDGSWWVLVVAVSGASSSEKARETIAEVARAAYDGLHAKASEG
jgi:beta-lactamase class A